jgi:hypothetical protein
LGVGLVDEAGQRIREELFAPDRKKDLIPALLSPAPEIVTTAVAAEAAGESEEETDEIPESDAPGT